MQQPTNAAPTTPAPETSHKAPFVARKATTCAVCHHGIRPGDMIQWHPGAPKGVPPYRRHEACETGPRNLESALRLSVALLATRGAA